MPATTGRRRSLASAVSRCRCCEQAHRQGPDVPNIVGYRASEQQPLGRGKERSVSATLITNIGELTTNVATDGDPCGTLHDAAVLIEGSRIVWVGSAAEAPLVDRETASATRDGGETPRSRGADVVSPSMTVVDAGGRAVIPGFVDSHTHLVFGGDRADEFEARMAGTPYAAGGIRRTVAATRAASDDELRTRLEGFVAELRAQGTTT